MKIIAFTGLSNSGKTTLIEKISKKLISLNFKVSIIKHDPKDKAIFDREGKDSDRFFKTGAQVAVIGNKRTTIFKRQKDDINDVIKYLGDNDYILIEGLKYLPFPRICVIRNQIDESYFDYSDIFAIKNINKALLPKDKVCIDLDNIDLVISYINKIALKV